MNGFEDIEAEPGNEEEKNCRADDGPHQFRLVQEEGLVDIIKDETESYTSQQRQRKHCPESAPVRFHEMEGIAQRFKHLVLCGERVIGKKDDRKEKEQEQRRDHLHEHKIERVAGCRQDAVQKHSRQNVQEEDDEEEKCQ